VTADDEQTTVGAALREALDQAGVAEHARWGVRARWGRDGTPVPVDDYGDEDE
jgi:hypothetical protein